MNWLGESLHTAGDLLRPAEGRGGTSSPTEAERFLTDLLADGPVRAKEVERRAKEAGLHMSTVQRAKQALGIRSDREGFGPGQRVLLDR